MSAFSREELLNFEDDLGAAVMPERYAQNQGGALIGDAIGTDQVVLRGVRGDGVVLWVMRRGSTSVRGYCKAE